MMASKVIECATVEEVEGLLEDGFSELNSGWRVLFVEDSYVIVMYNSRMRVLDYWYKSKLVCILIIVSQQPWNRAGSCWLFVCSQVLLRNNCSGHRLNHTIYSTMVMLHLVISWRVVVSAVEVLFNDASAKYVMMIMVIVQLTQDLFGLVLLKVHSLQFH